MRKPSQATLNFIQAHKEEDPKVLAFKNIQDVDMQFALQQISGYQIAKKKIPSLCACSNLRYPIHLSLEQCSSEKTAVYKSSFINKGDIFIDLTGGFGIDFYYLSKNFSNCTYIEQNTDLFDVATFNFKQLEMNVNAVNGSCIEFLDKYNQCADLIYVDPARRDANGSKIFLPSDCQPDITELQKLLSTKTKALLIKYSPLLDIKSILKSFDYISEIHIVSVENECKELLILINYRQETDNVNIYCSNIKNNRTDRFSYSLYEEENANEKLTDIKKYIYEPNASIMKAGCFKILSNKYNIGKLSTNSHLYSSDNLILDFPGRIFEVSVNTTTGKSEIKNALKGIAKANIAVRNYPSTVSDFRKKYKIKEGGDMYLFATTLHSNIHVLVGGKQIFKD